MILKPKLINKALRDGEVYGTKLFSNSNFEISKLVLKPSSAIVKHTHSIDNEVYFIYEKGKEVKIQVCRKGEAHSLKNCSNHDMIVFSVKCS